jgi:enoyl-CoA hydratase/carnithine racemase
MSYETLEFDVDQGGVGTITLNRPDRMNAFNKLMGSELVQSWKQVRENADIRAVVLRAAGDRAFCAGVDVREGGWGGDKPVFEQDDPGSSLGPKQNRVWKPVICAIHGMAAGGAFYFINEADIAICSEDATFFDPHVTFGKVAAVEPAGMLGRIPYGEICRMALMGNDERITAATALRIGLVTEVCTREALWSRAQELARCIAAKSPTAIQGTVRALWESQSLPRSLAVANAHKFTQLGNLPENRTFNPSDAPKVIPHLR